MKDIGKGKENKTLDGFIIPNQAPDYQDNQRLNQQVNNLFDGNTSYERSDRLLDDSGDFSTLA